MTNFLFFLSKTDTSIIRNCSPATRNIQFTLGFFVLLTGVLAFLSGGYAASNLFIHEYALTGKPQMEPLGWLYAVLIGLVYTVFIMAIDREVVAASNKWAVILRIPLAIIISIIVSVPVELQLFEGRITKKLLENAKADNDHLEEQLHYKMVPLEKRRDTLLALKNNAVKERQSWATIMDVEVVGNIRDGKQRPAGKGDAYLSAKENKEQANELITKCDSELAVVQSQLNTMQAQLSENLINQHIPQSYDLLSKYVTLNQVKEDDKTGAAARMSYGITFLFLLFELIPCIMKLLLPQTEYDAMLTMRRNLNRLSARKIYNQAKQEYETQTAEQVSQRNPLVVEQIFASQAKG